MAKLNQTEAIDRKLAGETLQSIGEIFGASKISVQQAIAKHFNGLHWESFKHFRANKDKWMEAVQFRLISLIDDNVATKMVSQRGVTDIGILEDKIRLLRGQSTENLDLHASFEALESVRSKREALEAALASKGIDIGTLSINKACQAGQLQVAGGIQVDQVQADPGGSQPEWPGGGGGEEALPYNSILPHMPTKSQKALFPPRKKAYGGGRSKGKTGGKGPAGTKK